ncbi:transcriptional regulator [Actinosynnema pretiosum]|uniref:Transcriptional regulator n=1 Tax=Actinosynnema pretiosum TaxID=42197 RepID=A0A290Z3N6_9PSEU|nr:transcriptional regulator [Actinosynnema pretiosum]ATE53640.1 transcriptional regulator [Actinosynnema pretiosum]
MPTSDQWLQVRKHLGQHRHAFAVQAADEYPDTPKLAGTPLLTSPLWTPAAPVPLDAIRLFRRAEHEFHGVTGAGDVATAQLPDDDQGERFPRYSAAMAALAAPAVFQNRSTYRLLSADLAKAHTMAFGAGTYFDGIDVGEACAHEYAARELGLVDGLALRQAVGDPCDPTRRPTNVAISTLTLRLDRTTGEATFFLHWRDPKRVGHAGGLYQVLPVGVFQASEDGPEHVDNDFSLWRSMIREFSEELLGTSEDHGGAVIDYDAWPFAARFTAELGERVRVFYLGMGVDPLTLATDMLTAAVVDAPLFDELFGDLVEANEEGRVLEAQAFTEDVVTRFVHDEPTQAAGAALLALAWEHRGALLA